MSYVAWFAAIAVLLAAYAALPAAESQSFEIRSASVPFTLEDLNHTSFQNVAVSCTGDALVYGLDMYVPRNDSPDRYVILEDSIRLGHQTLEHAPYLSGDAPVRIGLLEGFGGPGLPAPLLVPQYAPLVVPVHVLDALPGRPAAGILDVTYAANSGVECGGALLQGPQKVGLIVPTSGSASSSNSHVSAAVHIAVQDYNRYLEALGEAWRLELVVKNDEGDPAMSLVRAQELAAEGVHAVLGPSGSSALSAMEQLIRSSGMVVISCCSTAPSLAIPDHIFRMFPDDTNQAKALAALMEHDGIDSVVILYRDDTYGSGLSEALAAAVESRGGVVAEQMPFVRGGLDAGPLAQRAANAVGDLADARGVERVAVVVVASSEVAEIMSHALSHEILGNVRWYVSEAVVNLRSVTEGDLGEFSENTGLSGVTVLVPPSPLNEEVTRKLAAQLDLLPGESPLIFSYSAYDSVIVLGNAMLATQSAEPSDIVEALPHVSTRTFGTLSDDTLNPNGDLAVADYGVWKILGGHWVQTGSYQHHSDRVVAGQ